MEIAAMKIEQENMITKEMIISYIETLRDGDVTDPKFQQLMIDSFLAQAIVYDDHVKLIFNLTKEHAEVNVPLEFEGKGGSEESLSEGLFKLSTSPLPTGHGRTLAGFFIG